MVLRRRLKLIVIRWRVNGTLYLTIQRRAAAQQKLFMVDIER
jgi:hypothetical protein